MATKALSVVVPSAIVEVSVQRHSAAFDEGLLVTFSQGLTVYFDGTWLYDHGDVCGNFALDNDDPLTL